MDETAGVQTTAEGDARSPSTSRTSTGAVYVCKFCKHQWRPRAAAPALQCPKCHRTRWSTDTTPRIMTVSRVCKQCRGKDFRLRPDGSWKCRKCERRWEATAGLNRMRVSNPAVVPVLEQHRNRADVKTILWYERKGRPWVHRFFPSRFFPWIEKDLDAHLLKLGRNTDVALCEALQAVPSGERREFISLHIIDPEDARHWASLPRWQRLIRRGDEDDQKIWKLITSWTLIMRDRASETMAPWSVASQAMQYRAMRGGEWSVKDPKKLFYVMTGYLDSLADGQPLADPRRPPWKAGAR